MHPFLAIVSTRFRLLLQYRAAAFAGLFTQIFWGLVMLMIYEAFFRSSTRPQPLSLEQVVSYVWLGQALFAMQPWRGDRDLMALVRSGGVAYELMRPIDLYWFWFARVLSQLTAPTLLRSVPMFILAYLFFGFRLPATMEAGVIFLIATTGALFLSCAITMLINISTMWTISGEGVTHLLPGLVVLCSGMIIPLPFFPDSIQEILSLLPFRGLVDAPFRVYVGDILPAEYSAVLLHQILWVVALIAFGRWLLNIGIRRLVIQGG